jgi:hypothetical protein
VVKAKPRPLYPGERPVTQAPAALPRRKTRYPFYRRLGGPQGRSGQVQKISPPTGIRSPDRPVRSESLYRLSYPGPLVSAIHFKKHNITMFIHIVTLLAEQNVYKPQHIITLTTAHSNPVPVCVVPSWYGLLPCHSAVLLP